MEARTVDRDATVVAQRKLQLIRQQQLVAELARKGRAEQARRERAKLLALLNELDLIEALRETRAEAA
jgi:hypothetical protein